MTYTINTNYSACCIVIKLATAKAEQMCIVVGDNDLENTLFTNLQSTVKGDDTFYVNIPVCGKTTFIEIYNKKFGNDGVTDNSFIVKGINLAPIQQSLQNIVFANPKTKVFINFATRFCYNAGWLQPDTYYSDDKQFQIDYEDELIDEFGNVSETPARVDVATGIIELSRSKFVPMTIPNRMAIVLHEFAHIYLNENVDDETEADLNALNLYLSLGYPRIEAFEIFTQTFIDYPTEENQERFDFIKNFIDDFGGNKFNPNH